MQGKRKNLIANTLQKFDGEVHVEFLLNDVLHIVKRNSKTQEILLKIGDGAFSLATAQQVLNLLPVQAYSQKQLSSVGVQIDELKRFVELPIKQELDQIRSNVRDAEARNSRMCERSWAVSIGVLPCQRTLSILPCKEKGPAVKQGPVGN